MWQATAILHPFSPPPSSAQDPSPFFELCIANLLYAQGNGFSAQLLGASGRTWWYWVDNSNVTHLSTDQGATWNDVETGWQLPSTQWLASGRYFASGPLNWMKGAPSVDWWTQPVAGSNAATWIWNDPNRGLPVRMMFGAPPPTYDTGTADQLALFQNFSFTYFPTFAQVESFQPVWSLPDIPAFTFGNPFGLELFVWNSNFGMSTMMTPVNQASNPLPTEVLYHWAAPADYQGLADRAQRTTMSYVFNPPAGMPPPTPNPATEVILMFGGAPAGMPAPPANAGHWFDYVVDKNGSPSCARDPHGLVLGAEAPDWVSTPGEQGQIWGMVIDDPVVSPNNPVAIYSVLFPPSDQYPQGRFLWTWYSPMSDGSSGLHAQPVVFMESASNISEGGTSLALADYYDYQQFADPIPPGIFDIPPTCAPSAADADAAPADAGCEPVTTPA